MNKINKKIKESFEKIGKTIDEIGWFAGVIFGLMYSSWPIFFTLGFTGYAASKLILIYGENKIANNLLENEKNKNNIIKEEILENEKKEINDKLSLSLNNEALRKSSKLLEELKKDKEKNIHEIKTLENSIKTVLNIDQNSKIYPQAISLLENIYSDIKNKKEEINSVNDEKIIEKLKIYKKSLK